jgi:hypothetical protein
VLATLAIAEGGRIAFSEAGRTSLPAFDLFIKPQRGRGGRGASWWHYADGAYVDSTGTVLAPAALTARIEEASLREPFLIEPRAVNHTAIRDLSNGALCTARIITMEDEKGGFEPVAAAFRMAVGENRVVDNFHAGGIVANVDLATGVLGPAGDMALRPERGWCTHHPDTGGIIVGRRLPLWPETLELTSRAHRCFSGRTLIGWDVAILDDGPRVIEANGAPDVDLHQRCGGPLGTTRFGALLAYHIRRVEAREAATKSGA